MRKMGLTRDEAWQLANDWVAAWNAHDLDRIMGHYDEAVELTSPVAARLLGTPDGKVIGKANLRAYFARGLEAYPDLRFGLRTCCGACIAWCCITRIRREHATAEFMEISAAGKVVRVVANYNG